MAAKIKEDSGCIDRIINRAMKETMAPDFGGYGADFLRDEICWLSPSAIRRMSNAHLTKCREMLVKGEAHHQFSSHFVELMIEEDIPRFGGLPHRIGDRPVHRAAASFTTMMCNHELYLFQVLNGMEAAPTFNRGIPMTQRYYVTSNNAIPFMRYQARVMAGLGLWTIEKETQKERISHFVKPGPCLSLFMESYFKVVDWATDIIAEKVPESL